MHINKLEKSDLKDPEPSSKENEEKYQFKLGNNMEMFD